jgi:hypothetical protein
MLSDPWFYVAAAGWGCLALSLAHNITSGAKLRAELLAEFQKLKEKFASKPNA